MNYPYFGTALILLALALLAAFSWRKGRRLLAYAGLLCLPFGLFSFEFIPEYWDPKLLAWLGACSLEDLIFSGSTGLLACSFATGLFRKRLSWRVEPRTFWRRYLGIAALGVGLGYLLKYTLPNPEVMTSTMAGVTVSGVWMFYKRRDAWPLMLSGALGFGVFYLLLMKFSLALWPAFIDEWSQTVPLGFWWGVPVYELVWALGFGAVWPLLLAYVFDVSLLPLNNPAAAAVEQPG